MKVSRVDEFEKDEGWKIVEEEFGYIDEELVEFEKQLKEEEMKYQVVVDVVRYVKILVEQVYCTLVELCKGFCKYF